MHCGVSLASFSPWGFDKNGNVEKNEKADMVASLVKKRGQVVGRLNHSELIITSWN